MTCLKTYVPDDVKSKLYKLHSCPTGFPAKREFCNLPDETTAVTTKSCPNSSLTMFDGTNVFDEPMSSAETAYVF